MSGKIEKFSNCKVISVHTSIHKLSQLQLLSQVEISLELSNLLLGVNVIMNIFDLPNLPSSNEVTTILLQNKSVKIERIISTGQVSDWYNQDETEFVLLVEGKAKIEFENGEIVTLNKGDTITIEPHKKHRVIYTSNEPPCIWICVFF